jgi:putative ABC transport system ATP-binding protein
MPSSPVIELKNVTKAYDMGATKTCALCGVSTKIYSNELISVIGPSGSGKSTMMHIIGCLDTPTTGSVFIDGNDVSKLDENQLAKIRREKIGFVFQFFNLIPSLTAIENVTLPMRFSGVDKKKAEERAKMLLTRVGLSQRFYHKPSELSGGEQQRVAIARSLVNDPEVILADEPTGNLDTKSGAEILKLIDDLHKNTKKTIIIVTHDLNLAKKAKRVIHIKDGKIAKDEK